MAYEIGNVVQAGADLAHWLMLDKIKTFAAANGWTVLRYTTPTDGSNRELILRGLGLSGTEEIYIGFRTYHSISSDYYNLSTAAFTGYVPANAFDQQPGYAESGVPAHNQRVDYWLTVNPQCIKMVLKVGAGNYESGYAGKYFPYASPGQYPYPVACVGMLSGVAPVRYSETAQGVHQMGYRGQRNPTYPYACPQARLRDIQGTWALFKCAPWESAAAKQNRTTGGTYVAKKCVLLTDGQVWGELDGIRFITGFDQVVEATCDIGGVPHVVMRDGVRNGFDDYYLLELK